MNRLTYRKHIATLITKERLFIINKDEKVELHTWIQKSSSNRNMYRYLKAKDFQIDWEKYRQIDENSAWERCRKIQKKSSIIILTIKSLTAACVLSILTVCANLYFSTDNVYAPDEYHENIPSLTLSDGSIEVLDGTAAGKIIYDGNKKINNNNKELNYTTIVPGPGMNQDEKGEYNEIRIPRYCNYRLVLADGTKVWLNALSKLKFPIEFKDKKREIYLEGEAYFEVNKDSLHPFVVHTGTGVRIEVLGTSFNISAYAEKNTLTVLEKGSIKLSKGKESVILQAGEMAICSEESDEISCEQVNTELYTSWRFGQYIFINESLENILNKLTEWYDIRIFFANPNVRKLVFSGSIEKYEEITHILEALERSGGVRFEVKGDTITAR